jgi:hypothetical protein
VIVLPFFAFFDELFFCAIPNTLVRYFRLLLLIRTRAFICPKIIGVHKAVVMIRSNATNSKNTLHVLDGRDGSGRAALSGTHEAVLPGLRNEGAGGIRPARRNEGVSGEYKADFGRLDALAKTGGVWMDASCIVFDMQWLCNAVNLPNETEIVGFGAPWDQKVLENWTLAAPHPSSFVTTWRDEYVVALREGPPVYCDRVQ